MCYYFRTDLVAFSITISMGNSNVYLYVVFTWLSILLPCGACGQLSITWPHLCPGPRTFRSLIEAMADVRPKQEPKRSKWCLTLNNYTPFDLAEYTNRLFDVDEVAFAIIGKEVGDNGTPHLQMYVSYLRTKRKRFTQMKKLFEKAHIEPAKGDDFDNYAYCSKEGDFQQFGYPQEKGQRNDLKGAINTLVETKSMSMVAERHPEVFVRCHRGLTELQTTLKLNQVRSWKTDFTILTGHSGIGKTSWAMAYAEQKYGVDQVFCKGNDKWWDFYNGEKCVVIDEYNCAITWTELKLMANRKAMYVESKGKKVSFLAYEVVICSNSPIKDWYHGARDYKPITIERRCIRDGDDSQFVHVYHNCFPKFGPQVKLVAGPTVPFFSLHDRSEGLEPTINVTVDDVIDECQARIRSRDPNEFRDFGRTNIDVVFISE